MLEITLQYTKDDLARGNLFIFKRRFRHKKYFVIYLLLIGIGMLVFAFAQPAPDWRSTFVMIGILVLLMLPVLFVFERLLARQVAKQAFKSNPHVRKPQTYAFGDENMTISGELFDTNLKWPVVVEAAETETDFFLYITKDQAYVLPKRVLKTGEEPLLRSLLKAKLQERAKLN